MRLTVFVLFALALHYPNGACNASPVAQIISESFEIDRHQNVPDGWKFIGRPQFVTITKAQAKTGAYSILVDQDVGRASGAMLHPGLVQVTGNVTYRLSAWVKVERSEPGAYARAMVHFLDKERKLLSRMACRASSVDPAWQLIEATDKAPPGAAYVRLFAPYVKGSMRLYMDDVQLVEMRGNDPPYGIHDIAIPGDRRATIENDANFRFFGAGGNGYLFSSVRAIDRLETKRRRANTIGVEIPPGRGIEEFIAEDVKFHPYVSTWHDQSRRLYPHNRTGRRLGVYVTAYKLTGCGTYLKRIKELADFLLYSQYGDQGQNQFLQDFYPKDYAALRQNPASMQWHGGWPTHDFTWRNEHHTFARYEPSHHMDAQGAFSLVRAYEVSGDARYLDAVKRFVEGSNRLFGKKEGMWEGEKFYWTEYDPVAPLGSPNDSVNNVVAWYAMAVAALGFHTGDPAIIELGRGLLWYMCKEIMQQGRWYYFGEEAFIPPARWSPSFKRKISHEPSCLIGVNTAMLYLERAGIDTQRMKSIFARANLLYMQMWGDEIKALKTFNVRDNLGKLTFTTFIYVVGKSLVNIDFADKVPGGFMQPRYIELAVRRAGTMTRRVISKEQFMKGVTVCRDPAMGEIIELSYSLVPPDDYKMLQAFEGFGDQIAMQAIPAPVVRIAKKDGTAVAVSYPHVQVQQFQHINYDAERIMDLPRYLLGPPETERRESQPRKESDELPPQ